MRKSIFISLLFAIASIMATGCSSCKSENKKQETEVGNIVVENCISSDREFMFLHYDSVYTWYETSIVLKDYLDEECDGSVDGLTNLFQVVTEVGNGYDTHVVLATHTGTGEAVIEDKPTFCVGDLALNNDDIKITFADALKKINEVNLPKPHSRQCVLRKELGPKPCNPQYIFGNVKAQLYVDAITGDVTDKNPAYND